MEAGPESAPRHGDWLRPVLGLALVVAVLVVAFLLVDHTSLGHRLFGGSDSSTTSAAPPAPRATALTPSAVNSFDPEGTGPPGENDAELPLAIDDNPATAWSTEGYDDRLFGHLKQGVGISLSAGPSLTVGLAAGHLAHRRTGPPPSTSRTRPPPPPS